MSKRETSSEIDEAAASWALRIDEAALGDEAQATFDSWLQGDIRRVGAFARAQAVLVHAKRAKALGSEFEPASFSAEKSAVEIVDPLPAEPAAPAGLTRRRMLIGASALAAGGAIAFFIPMRRASARIYETALGETRLVPLEDGSTVTLNTESRIAVTMDKARRSVELVQGEALFKLGAPNPAPFVVEAGDVSVSAQDATFAVCRLEAQPLQIRVCEGNVEVKQDALLSSRRHILRANMQATMQPNGEMIERSVTPELLVRELSWQEGMLSFEDTPLSQAAEEFARYSDRRIRIADPIVRAETVTGRYAANNPEGFARAVALGLNLRVQTTPGGILIAR